MKKLLSLFCTLSLSAALLAGCSGGNGNTNAAADGAESTSPTLTEPETTSQQETAAPVDVNVMALKGPRCLLVFQERVCPRQTGSAFGFLR